MDNSNWNDAITKQNLDTLKAGLDRLGEFIDNVLVDTTAADNILEGMSKHLEEVRYSNTAATVATAGGYENQLERLRKTQQEASQTRDLLCRFEGSWKKLQESCSRSCVRYQDQLLLLRMTEEDISNDIDCCLESIKVQQEEDEKIDAGPRLSSTVVEDQTQKVENLPESMSTEQNPQDDVEKPYESSTLVIKEESKKEDTPQDVENPEQKVDEERKNVGQKPQNIEETWREVGAACNRHEDRYSLGEYFTHAIVKKKSRKAKR